MVSHNRLDMFGKDAQRGDVQMSKSEKDQVSSQETVKRLKESDLKRLKTPYSDDLICRIPA